MIDDVPVADLWRQPTSPAEFDDAVGLVADGLGVQPLAVEKDYWVCEALRAIVAVNSDIIFKGGTSLAKMGIIERFSEDLDLLAPSAGQSANGAKALLKKMCMAAEKATFSPEADIKRTRGGKAGTLHRESQLRPPIKNQSMGTVSAIADPESILILNLSTSICSTPAEHCSRNSYA